MSTLEFKDNVLKKKSEERSDSTGELVKDRILGKSRQDNQVSGKMTEIFNYIENPDYSHFTLKEIIDLLKGYVPDEETIITRLQQKYLTNILIKTKAKYFTIISFRDTQANKLSKAWYVNKKRDPEEERLRIVKAAAAIIRGHIRSSIVETKCYPPPSAVVQYVGYNADINIYTLGGNNTLHVMGIIKIVTPKDDVLYDDRIQKCTSKPCTK
ncbi:SWIM-type domain-containing protein [Trichonephila clavipes]|nr:SWIM-type domain-containing protein [Trichonephila clavipes]